MADDYQRLISAVVSWVGWGQSGVRIRILRRHLNHRRGETRSLIDNLVHLIGKVEWVQLA